MASTKRIARKKYARRLTAGLYEGATAGHWWKKQTQFFNKNHLLRMLIHPRNNSLEILLVNQLKFGIDHMQSIARVELQICSISNFN